jgi:hypothetical protein
MPVTRSKTKTGGGRSGTRSSAPAKIVYTDIDSEIDDLDVSSESDSDSDSQPAKRGESRNKRRKPSPNDSSVADADSAAAAVILAHKADVARAQIRGLINSLPDAEASLILDVLDNPPDDDEETPAVGFFWDDLPPEVKNMIYRCVFVKDTPVKPNISWPNVPDKREIDKCGLGAHFLRCNKAIYIEGRTILRGENVFEIGPHFKVCFGIGKFKQTQNVELMQKAMVKAAKYSYNVQCGLNSMTHLKELTINAKFSYEKFDTKEGAEKDAALAWDLMNYRLRYKVILLNRKLDKLWFVAERLMKVSW